MSIIRTITCSTINDSIRVDLEDSTVLEFKAEYSPYEDCVDLILNVDGKQRRVSLDVFVGYDDHSHDRAMKRRNK
jgi:hypothetical protein